MCKVETGPGLTLMRQLTVFFLICGSLAGCAPPNREALVKEVLKADPAFASVLDKHRELTNRIETYERELALKRSTVERTIAQMRKDLVTAAANVRSRTAETKKRMQPDRGRLDHALSTAGAGLHAKRAQRASLGRLVTKLRKAIKSAGPVWTAEERARQEAQVQEILRDAARLDQEMAAMREHIRLVKIKLLLIKL
jgi:uncharacterized protein YdcH (DUF465 family)